MSFGFGENSYIRRSAVYEKEVIKPLGKRILDDENYSDDEEEQVIVTIQEKEINQGMGRDDDKELPSYPLLEPLHCLSQEEQLQPFDAETLLQEHEFVGDGNFIDELPILDVMERIEVGESDIGSPPTLEAMETYDDEEESYEAEVIFEANQASTSSSSLTSAPVKNQLSLARVSRYDKERDNGECPPFYREVLRKDLPVTGTRFRAIYSIQRPVEWSCSNKINSQINPMAKEMYQIKKPNERGVINVNYRQSLKLIPTPLKPYSKMKCPICSLVLFRHNYGVHFRIHSGEMPYKCYFCDRRFRTSSSRKIHHRWHTGERPYPCSSCNYKTITKRNLDRHVQNIHEKVVIVKESENVEKVVEEEKVEEKKVEEKVEKIEETRKSRIRILARRSK